MRKNRKVRTAASLAVTAVLSAAVFLLFFSIELLFGYLNPHSFRESLRLSGYTAGMEEEHLQKQKALFASHGLPESLTEEIWGESKAYLAFSGYVEDGKIKEGGDDFGQREVLEDYLKNQQIYETQNVQKAIDLIVSESQAISRRYVFPSFVGGYLQFVQERRSLFTGMAIASALIGALCALLLFHWYHARHHALYYITGSFVTAAIWNLAGMVLIGAGEWFAISGVKSAYYQQFLDIFKTRGMYPWYLFCIVEAAAAALMLVVSLRMRKR